MGVVPRQSFLPVGVNALPHLKRYPKQVVDSNKMLPESQIYVMTLGRTKFRIINAALSPWSLSWVGRVRKGRLSGKLATFSVALAG